MSIPQEIASKLRKIINVSTRMQQEQMRSILKMSIEDFNDRIVDWAEEYGFKIDGEYINFVAGSDVTGFIAELDNQFKQWGQKSKGEVEKVVEYDNTPLVTSECAALTALEKHLGKPIPKVAKMSWNSFGFISVDTHVIELNLSQQGLTILPNSIENFRSLKKLHIANNNITTLTGRLLRELESLEYLNLNTNQLTTFPENFGDLKALKIFDASQNQLKTLPESIGNLVSLQNLNLAHNRLPILPRTIGNLQSLRYFNLNSNQLGNLPDSIGNLGSLRQLRLHNNQIKSLPDTIGNLKNLQILKLEHNELKILPETFGNLISLKKFYLAFNQITGLPKSVENLQRLKRFYIGRNQIKILEEEGFLTKLKRNGCVILEK